MSKFNARCSECGRPCKAPTGNWNARTVVICRLKKCKRARKTALQRERRKQKELFPLEARKRVKKDSQRKLKFFGGLVD